MSDADGTCEYVLDPDDPDTWGGEEGEECYIDEEVLNEDGVWACPHGATEDNDRCIFHLPVKEKDDDDVVEAFRDTVGEVANSDGAEVRRLEFIGAKFGAFDLSENHTDLIMEDDRLSIAYATVNGVLDWSETVLEAQKIIFNGVKFSDNTRFRGMKVEGEVGFKGAEFEESTDFVGAEFGGITNFGYAEFVDGADFRGTEFGKEAFFIYTVFRGETIFTGAHFEGETYAMDAEFEGETYAIGTEFVRGAHLGNTEFEGDTYFANAEFGQKADFGDAEFGQKADFEGVKFEEGPIFENLTLDGAQFGGGNLTDAKFTGANLRSANFESALLSRATLFNADLRGAKLSGAVLGDVRIDEGTQFLGHPDDDSDTSPHSLSAIRSRPTCVYDPDYEEDNEHKKVDKAKSVYRALEELGAKHARPRLQARSFVRRQDLQKNEYERVMLGKEKDSDDGEEEEGPSREERLIAGARWSRTKVARATLLYGESPWRIIAWSLGIILSFALLFPLGGWIKPEGGDPITYAQIASNPIEFANSVYYSTLTFTALGFGDFKPVGWGRALITIETGLGAILLALLVFVFGRRATR